MAEFNLTQILTTPWVIPVCMGCLVAIVAILAGISAGCISGVAETKLKRAMVERGFSAAEIERVVKASTCGEEVPPKPFTGPKQYSARVS